MKLTFHHDIALIPVKVSQDSIDPMSSIRDNNTFIGVRSYKLRYTCADIAQDGDIRRAHESVWICLDFSSHLLTCGKDRQRERAIRTLDNCYVSATRQAYAYSQPLLRFI